MSDNKDFEVIIGDDSNLSISEVGDCMNNLRPKTSKKKNLVIPLVKKKKENSDKKTKN